MAEPTIQQAFGENASLNAGASELLILTSELDPRLEDFEASSEAILYAILSRFNTVQDTEPDSQCTIVRSVPTSQQDDPPDTLRVRFEVDFRVEADLDPRNL